MRHLLRPRLAAVLADDHLEGDPDGVAAEDKPGGDVPGEGSVVDSGLGEDVEGLLADMSCLNADARKFTPTAVVAANYFAPACTVKRRPVRAITSRVIKGLV